jgi:tetratricopeptide (TPR) repeat protein
MTADPIELPEDMMFRKPIISILSIAAIVIAAQTAIFAQTAPVSGSVELEKADGTREPVANATVEVYRVDIKTGAPAAKTNKKGEFAFAGLQLGGTYVLSVSAPGASPTIFPNVKAGQEKLLVMMTPGDGSKLSEADARSGATAKAAKPGSGETPQLTAEEKKQQAEFEKKNAEITAKNKKTQEGDSIARKSYEEGNAALKAENWDVAVAKFSEGVAAVPDYVGSTPVLLNGKMLALKAKGFAAYRQGATSTDVAIKTGKYQEANGFYDEALAAFQAAIAVIKNAEAAPDAAETKRRDLVKAELYATASEIHRLKAVGSVDMSKAAEADAIITEYIAMEADPVRKLSAQVTLGDIMRVTGDFDKAVAAYKKVLEIKADHPEALGSLGLSLFAQGVSSVPEDKAKMQEGLNFMQKYTEIAPVQPTDPPAVKELKTSIKDAVADLKTRNMTPQKITIPKKGGRP